MFACPQNQHIGSGCLGFPTRIVIISPWLSNSPGPTNQHPGSARHGFSDTDPDPWSFSIWWNSPKSALLGNYWRSPPVSSDTGSDPWTPLRSPLDPKGLPGTCLSTSKIEGVTTDLDPVRKHLEESSGQFRQGLTCFLILVLHTYLTRQTCESLPGQRFLLNKLVHHVGSNTL